MRCFRGARSAKTSSPCVCVRCLFCTDLLFNFDSLLVRALPRPTPKRRIWCPTRGFARTDFDMRMRVVLVWVVPLGGPQQPRSASVYCARVRKQQCTQTHVYLARFGQWATHVVMRIVLGICVLSSGFDAFCTGGGENHHQNHPIAAIGPATTRASQLQPRQGGAHVYCARLRQQSSAAGSEIGWKFDFCWGFTITPTSG